MDLRKAYEVLMLPYGASFEQVKKAYREEALLVHPDRVQNSSESVRKRAEEKFKLINEAFQTISKAIENGVIFEENEAQKRSREEAKRQKEERQRAAERQRAEQQQSEQQQRDYEKKAEGAFSGGRKGDGQQKQSIGDTAKISWKGPLFFFIGLIVFGLIVESVTKRNQTPPASRPIAPSVNENHSPDKSKSTIETDRVYKDKNGKYTITIPSGWDFKLDSTEKFDIMIYNHLWDGKDIGQYPGMIVIFKKYLGEGDYDMDISYPQMRKSMMEMYDSSFVVSEGQRQFGEVLSKWIMIDGKSEGNVYRYVDYMMIHNEYFYNIRTVSLSANYQKYRDDLIKITAVFKLLEPTRSKSKISSNEKSDLADKESTDNGQTSASKSGSAYESSKPKEKSNSYGSYWSIGSGEFEVRRIQGTPTSVSELYSKFILYYGSSSVTFDLKSKRVTEYCNSSRNLRVRGKGDASSPSTTEYWSIGSSEYEVRRIQGTPTSVSELYSKFILYYGSSSVTFDLQSKRVTEYSNSSRNLRVRGKGDASSPSTTEYWSIGSSEYEVRRIQGTPMSVSELYSKFILYYGSSSVTFDLQSKRVTEYSNSSGNLRVR